MSGKTARKLRQLAKAQTGKDLAIEPGDNRAYNDQHVPSNREHEYSRPAFTTVRKLNPNHPRAFYQEAKKVYKSGEGAQEAKRIKDGFRAEQKKAARKVAEDIHEALKDRQLQKAENGNPEVTDAQ